MFVIATCLRVQPVLSALERRSTELKVGGSSSSSRTALAWVRRQERLRAHPLDRIKKIRDASAPHEREGRTFAQQLFAVIRELAPIGRRVDSLAGTYG